MTKILLGKIAIFIFLLLNFAYAHAAITAKWNFNSCSGDLILNQEDSGDGQIIGGQLWGAGFAEQGFTFDGSNRIEVDDNGTFAFSEAVTIAIRFRTTYGGMLVNREDPTVSPRRGYSLHVNGEGSVPGAIALNCFSQDGVRAFVNTFDLNGIDYRDGDWHSVVGICTNHARLFVDGTLIGESDNELEQIGISQENLVVGDRLTTSYPFDGVIDDLEIYGRALDTTEIQNYFQKEVSVQGCGLRQLVNWDFDYCSGSIVEGIIDGVISEGPYWVEGYQGTTMSFREGTYVSSSLNHDVVRKSVTMSAWVKTTQGGMIINKEYPRDNPRSGFSLHINGEGSWAGTAAVNCFSGNGVRSWVNSGEFNNIDYRDGSWHHLVGICDVDESGAARLYIDGTLIGASTQQVFNIGENDLELTIGERPEESLPFSGLIDNIQIIKGVWSEAQVLEESQAQLSSQQCDRNLLSNWSANGCFDSSLVESVSSFNGVLIGAVTWLEGYIEQALNLSGAEWVEVPYSSVLTGGNGVSISVWIKTSTGGMIVGNENPTSSPRQGYSLHINGDGSYGGSIALNCFSSTGERIFVNSLNHISYDYRDAQWHHLIAACGVRDDGKAHLYVDGELIGTSEDTIDNIGDGQRKILIGNREGVAFPFIGLIDDLKIFDGAISDNQIEALSNVSFSGLPCSYPPVANFEMSASIVVMPETVAFDATLSSDTDGEITYYIWDFGDGTQGSGITISHQYQQYGSFEITLTVVDGDGNQNIMTKTLIVKSGDTTHPNGGGYVGLSAIVSDEVYVAAGAAVTGDAVVMGNSFVAEGAIVQDSSFVLDSTISEDALISENATILNSFIGGGAVVGGYSSVEEGSYVYGSVLENAKIISATVLAKAVVQGNGEVSSGAVIEGTIDDDAQVMASFVGENGLIEGSAIVRDESKVEGTVFDNAIVEKSTVLTPGLVYGDAYVSSHSLIEGKVYGAAQVNESSVLEDAEIYGEAFFYNSTAFGIASVDFQVENGTCNGNIEYDIENCKIMEEK